MTKRDKLISYLDTLYLGDGYLYDAHRLLNALSDYDEKFIDTARHFFDANKTSIVSKRMELGIGATIHKMKVEHSCSYNQSFLFFAKWSSYSKRHIANIYYNYKKNLEKRLNHYNNNANEHTENNITQFDSETVIELLQNSSEYSDEINELYYKNSGFKWLLTPIPEDFPKAKQALLKIIRGYSPDTL